MRTILITAITLIFAAMIMAQPPGRQGGDGPPDGRRGPGGPGGMQGDWVKLLDSNMDQVLDACPELNQSGAQVTRSNSLETVRNMVASGLGVSVLPRDALTPITSSAAAPSSGIARRRREWRQPPPVAENCAGKPGRCGARVTAA